MFQGIFGPSKQRLIEQMGSSDNHVALQAVEKLKAVGIGQISSRTRPSVVKCSQSMSDTMKAFRLILPFLLALPTLVFVDRGGRLHQVVQRSMDFADELRPLIEDFLNGVAPAPSPRSELRSMERSIRRR